ncbi:MAG TPA: hypothetical protein VHH36_00235, partial [Candidatus Thermoplasmatota archaeon]|nr:hypothetical protein [Candidatus Thermoplasmatota archaeon]
LWVVAGFRLYESKDGGATWSAGEDVPRPEGARKDANPWNFAVPVADEAGNVLVAYDLGDDKGYTMHAAVRAPDGRWSVSNLTSSGTHHMPWPAAGPEGGFVVAWYGTDDESKTPNTVSADAAWSVFLAATHDAGASWEIVRADPEPVATGPLNRRLLDFLQVDLAPDGAAHLVYAENRDGTNEERTRYVRTTVGLGLAPLAYPNGPKAATGAQADGLAVALG